MGGGRGFLAGRNQVAVAVDNVLHRGEESGIASVAVLLEVSESMTSIAIWALCFSMAQRPANRAFDYITSCCCLRRHAPLVTGDVLPARSVRRGSR